MAKINRKDLRRKQIIEAAIDVFGNGNFHEASITEIARKANISEGTIYFYFKNKEDLFFAIPAQKIEEFCEELEFQLEGIQDAFNKLKKYTWFYLFHFKTNPAYARSLMLEMHVNKNFYNSKTSVQSKRATDKALEIIRQGQEEGLFRKDIDEEVIQALLLGMLEYRVTKWVLKDQAYDLLENYGDICEVIFNGIKSSENI
ncbi:transcriptional regulator, TetR family [Syntrophus gentianae]|uniref:Transcriptional regulator, TetR family n=1 Tax=Syntrophus gentianae TaxID=43775 RepID=A0A1H7YZB9_9BACT|nr:TetR/AcrR family transcriptional regulator [Syntrophus gentianae]SEM51520.1 transcriptional regulator, TetR family [Syntrophus gentianae]